MATSPIQSILKIEDLTSEEEYYKPINNEVLHEEYLIEDDEIDDESMTAIQNTTTQDAPSTSFTENDSQNAIVEKTQIPDNREFKHYVKTNPIQFQKLTSFMIAHPEFSKMTIKTPESRIKFNEFWIELSNSLNQNGPPTRGTEGWKKVWSDYKSHIRNKIRKNKIFYAEPRSEWQKRPYPLSPLEQKIATFMEYSQQDTPDVTSTLSSGKAETQLPSTSNSSTTDETTQHLADQSDVHQQQPKTDVSNKASQRYSPPLSRKYKRELLQSQIENQKDYTRHSKKILLEINDNLKGMLKYSIKNFELKQKRYELEKEKFMFKKKIEARKYQTDMEKLQLQRDILRLKQETIGLTN